MLRAGFGLPASGARLQAQGPKEPDLKGRGFSRAVTTFISCHSEQAELVPNDSEGAREESAFRPRDSRIPSGPVRRPGASAVRDLFPRKTVRLIRRTGYPSTPPPFRCACDPLSYRPYGTRNFSCTPFPALTCRAGFCRPYGLRSPPHFAKTVRKGGPPALTARHRNQVKYRLDRQIGSPPVPSSRARGDLRSSSRGHAWRSYMFQRKA